MSEPSAILRALRPRTQHKVRSSKKQQENEESEEEEVDGEASQVDDVTDLSGLNDSKGEDDNNHDNIDNNLDNNNENINDDDDNNDYDDDDDYDDDEPRLTIKEEPEDDVADEKIVSESGYECKSCEPSIEFPSLVEYLQHLKDEHHQKPKCHECPHCNFISQHPKRLERHLLSIHKDIEASNQSNMDGHQKIHPLKRRFFRCTKCSYMTHVRARYTKHVKYHSMPMIKCNDCDFRTPYKWNLDRHTRSHNGGGAFQCRACNFTAEIRQSLTVHETNHHEPPVGVCNKKLNPLDRKPRNGPKRYNQVGASDFREPSQSSPSKSPVADGIDNSLEETPNTVIADAECIALKCDEKGCQFITAWDSEMQRHLIEAHGPLQSPNKARKPLPMLIPLSPEGKVNNSIPNGSPNTLKVPRVRVRPELAKIARDTEMAKLYSNRETTGKKEVTVKSFEKRNASFFDRLKERLMGSTNAGSSQVAVSNREDLKCWCTFEAISLEELAKHKQTHHTALSVSSSITRCPNCRRHCKNLTDLELHMKFCSSMSNNLMISNNSQENTVISTNYTATSNCDDFEFPLQVDWEGSVGGLNSSGSSADGVTQSSSRRVFKCPHCPFWASTASRFHVHIVGHLNRKPFECSFCAYRSNWRWDITKHIKLKSARDAAHATARVLMTDETGRRNYSKYNKYLAQIDQQIPHDLSEDHGVVDTTSGEPPKKLIIMSKSKNYPVPQNLTPAPSSYNNYGKSDSGIVNSAPRPPPPLQSRNQGQSLLKVNPSASNPNVAISVYASNSNSVASTSGSTEESKRTLWKCKKCNFRDANKEMVLQHVKTHYESSEQSSSGLQSFIPCNECPFKAEDTAALAIHQVNHRPDRDKIFKCYHCPYYVRTKAELLEHGHLHGQELAVEHKLNSNVDSSPNKIKLQNQSAKLDISVEEVSHVSSPILAAAVSGNNEGAAPPLLLDTRALPDTPLVWVSRPDGTFAKMLKCRHCPHVSTRRAEVRDHETMHTLASVNDCTIACPDCSFRCLLRETMDAHTDMHRGSLGTVHCLVDDGRSDAQQLEDLTTLLDLPRTPKLGPEPDLCDPRLLYCCNKCPARFLCDKELRIHIKYHSNDLSYSCEWCSYGSRQQSHLSAHQRAHTSEYQERTRYLLSLYGHSQRYPPPRTACVETNSQVGNTAKNIAWIVVQISGSGAGSSNQQKDEDRTPSQVFTCSKCPARYFKLDALEYHMTLHGSNNRFKCTECDYSSKTGQNLLKHQVVHRRQTEINEPSATQLHSPQDPPFNPLMQGNPNFVYQGYVKNGKVREKRFKCHKCPSAFEKREQYRVHLTLHGAKQRYRCDTCDYSVKYYANYVQHLKKHHANAQSQASQRQDETSMDYDNNFIDEDDVNKSPSKSRRKSTISSNTLGNNSSTAGFSASSVSNQDKQSIILMQKKSNTITPFTLLRCTECPFSSTDKDTVDAHKRRHGIDRLTPPCPHCNYVPRKDENVSEHIRLHFTRLYKPESYLVIDSLSLTMRKMSNSKKDDKHKENELIFRECDDGKYLPVAVTNSLPVTNGSNFEKIIVDPNTGEATRFSM
ncbi:zinc finger protein 729-like isoform X1 [Microplitis mediator]|uniref:zinc finger protein 729-like isoform X1 n=1 Tax=Microplitis mediator TaxID=375433 RepID=UPI0025535F3E|nr:zinc finger protein 729-like isoform X1 [Microplitis mediator]